MYCTKDTTKYIKRICDGKDPNTLIKRAYKEQLIVNHPDKSTNKDASIITQGLYEAKEKLLSNRSFLWDKMTCDVCNTSPSKTTQKASLPQSQSPPSKTTQKASSSQSPPSKTSQEASQPKSQPPPSKTTQKASQPKSQQPSPRPQQTSAQNSVPTTFYWPAEERAIAIETMQFLHNYAKDIYTFLDSDQDSAIVGGLSINVDQIGRVTELCQTLLDSGDTSIPREYLQNCIRLQEKYIQTQQFEPMEY